MIFVGKRLLIDPKQISGESARVTAAQQIIGAKAESANFHHARLASNLVASRLAQLNRSASSF